MELFDEIDILKNELSAVRPLSAVSLASLREDLIVKWTYNSNGIEGNTLTLKETKVVLEGITVGGKTIREHLEAKNHQEAIYYLEEIINQKEELSEWQIKNIHHLILHGIDDDHSGKYRTVNVVVSGAEHIPTDSLLIQEEMEKLIAWHKSASGMHPVERAARLHTDFVGIHPFIDGNGRTARLLLNFELMKSGYAPVIIKKEDRLSYYQALDLAHTKGSYREFIEMVGRLELGMLQDYLAVCRT